MNEPLRPGRTRAATMLCRRQPPYVVQRPNRLRSPQWNGIPQNVLPHQKSTVRPGAYAVQRQLPSPLIPADAVDSTPATTAEPNQLSARSEWCYSVSRTRQLNGVARHQLKVIAAFRRRPPASRSWHSHLNHAYVRSSRGQVSITVWQAGEERTG